MTFPSAAIAYNIYQSEALEREIFCLFKCTAQNILHAKPKERRFLTFKQSFLFFFKVFNDCAFIFYLTMHKKKPNLNKKDRDKDIGHQTARSAKKKKEVFINDPLPQFKASKCPSPEFFFYQNPISLKGWQVT